MFWIWLVFLYCALSVIGLKKYRDDAPLTNQHLFYQSRDLARRVFSQVSVSSVLRVLIGLFWPLIGLLLAYDKIEHHT